MNLKKPDIENGKITKNILIVLYFMLIIVLIILLFLTYKIVFLKVEETNNKNTTINTKNIINEYEYLVENINIEAEENVNFVNKIQILKDDFNNNDIIAYINIPETNISYPVVQTVDNEFYLNNDINKKKVHMVAYL